MDFLDFTDCTLYFEEPLPAAVEALLGQAAATYGTPAAEAALLAASRLAPDSLSVLVGQYRYYFYQHRLAEALQVADRAMALAAGPLGLPTWSEIDEAHLAAAAANSFGLLRFYLLALKASGIVLLRLGDSSSAHARLRKLATLDQRDQLGAGKLLEVVAEFRADDPSTATSCTIAVPHPPFVAA